MLRAAPNNSIIFKFIYLFLIDITSVKRRNFVDYEKTEPGYANAWLKAYVEMFSEPKTGEITHERLLKIHRFATAHLPNSTPGRYKIRGNYYGLRGNPWPRLPLKNTTYNINEEGLLEFVQEWLVKPPLASIHIVTFGKRNQTETGYILKNTDGELELITVQNRKGFKTQKLDLRHDKEILLNFMQCDEFEIDITSMPEVKPAEIPATVIANLDDVFSKFKSAMLTAKTDADKIYAILTHVQKIAQIHPFEDGNIRTCYILINLLLRDNNLSPALLLNANRLDCCSRNNLKEMVMLGQGYFTKLLENESTTLTLTTKEAFLPELSFSAQVMPNVCNQLLTQFCEKVLRISCPSNLASTKLGLFNESDSAKVLLASVTKKLGHLIQYASLLEALKKGQTELALRKACADSLFDIVKEILAFKEKLNIDLNKPSTNGKTALDWLLECSVQTGKDETVSLLREKGAKTKAELAQFEVRAEITLGVGCS